MKMKLLFLLMLSVYQARTQEKNSIKIAFLADVHFQDLYGNLEGTDYPGVLNPETNVYTLLRTMDSQLHSTRIFNENYFAFLAALNDIAERNIKLVALPGDYTDDGQPIHLRGLKRILNSYSEKYGIRFFITTGNHDPVGPFAQDAGKNDFLGERGKRQPLFSKDNLYSSNPRKEHPVVVTRDIAKMGYAGIMNSLSDFGFFPQQDYLYWETPFSKYSPATYHYKKALESSKIENRTYQLNDTLQIPDASYLVEPVKDLWLVAIDGNTYIPKKNGELSGAGIGYNNTIDYKEHLFIWLKDVAEKAEKLNKTLIAFSHYPAVDFNEDASEELRRFLGKKKWQLERVPEEKIARTLAKSGIKIHFAGHMHINDTGKRSYDDGRFIVNIQTPSLAAYIPGYKILSLKDNIAEIETVVINEVPRFDELFPLYEMEHKFLEKSGQPTWDKAILESRTYRDFTESHLENLVKLRFIPDDWPTDFCKFLSNLSGKELLLLSRYHGALSPLEFLKNEPELLKVENQLQLNVSSTDFKNWTGEQMILDFYKIRNADKLAFRDIPKKRLDQYFILLEAFQNNLNFKNSKNQNAQKLWLFMSIFNKFTNGLPSDHFSIDLETGEISEL